MNNYIKQIWYELRHQPMVTLTSVLGTAFSIFLIMVVYMTASIDTVEISPESRRGRILTGKYIHISEKGGGNSSGGMSYTSAKKLYGDLEGIEKMSYVSESWDPNQDISYLDGEFISMPVKNVDNVFWEIFDYKFIAGKPFDKAESDAAVNRAVITESAARKLIGSAEDAVGKEIKVSHVPYIIKGVIKDTSPLMPDSYAKIFIPFRPEKEDETWLDGYAGNTLVHLLMKKGVDDEYVRDQVRHRYETMNSTLAKEDKELIYHESPFTAETSHTNMGSNTSPDTKGPRRNRLAIYAILLLLPAINLSSMTRSRLRRRVAEIGVRRAFGATKLNILNRFLTENLIATLIGGAIGFLLCLVFVAFFSNLFISYGGLFASGEILEATPTFGMLMSFSTFGMALLFCLVLNILSTGLPAWRAARINPAEAISGKND